MRNVFRLDRALCALFLATLITLSPLRQAAAHCDGMDGPVMKASREALDSGDINRILIWIPKEGEPEVRDIFEKVVAVRKLKNPEAGALAERYFFETVVRVHRAAEGASYTGLKPAGRDLGPAIPDADKAIQDGSLKELGGLLTGAMNGGLKARFDDVMHKRNFKKDDVEAGREYVEAYVRYIHYAEKLYAAAVASPQGHYDETGAE